ncbi:MFS transporter [Frigoribacterium sp. NBH87]|nr:MFS transporter [Frigoribacterium sp. NBH87]
MRRVRWSLLRIPAFRALWVGRLLSWVGSGLAPLALVFAAIDLGADAVGVGLVVAARSVPNVVLVLVGGAVSDRLPRRVVTVGSSVLSAASLTVAGVLLLADRETLVTLAVAAAVNGAAAAFFGPATSALLRDVVPDEAVRDGTVLARTSMNAGLVVGTALGGAVVGVFGTGAGLIVGAVLFGAAAVVFVRVPGGPSRASGGASLLRDLAAGVAFVSRSRWLTATVVLTFVYQFAFAGGVHVLGPLIADQSFGRVAWGFAGAVQTAGLVVGAVWAGSLRGRLRLATAALGAVALVAPLMLLAGTLVDLPYVLDPPLIDPLHWFFWLCVGLFVASVGLEVFTVPLDVAVQLQVPRSYLGRVFACLTLASLAGMPAGELAVGPLSRVIGEPLTLTALAGLVTVVALAVAATPRVRRVDAPRVPAGRADPADAGPADATGAARP